MVEKIKSLFVSQKLVKVFLEMKKKNAIKI